ncbi:MAG: hypothetical protein WCW77_01995 [Patescibacteria group bacterium]|jgi:hypothetical protein
MINEYLGTLNILVSEREVNAPEINNVITKFGHLVRARLGIHLSPKCVKGCSGLITLVVQGEKKELEKFAKEAAKHKYAVAKLCYISKVK